MGARCSASDRAGGRIGGGAQSEAAAAHRLLLGDEHRRVAAPQGAWHTCTPRCSRDGGDQGRGDAAAEGGESRDRARSTPFSSAAPEVIVDMRALAIPDGYHAAALPRLTPRPPRSAPRPPRPLLFAPRRTAPFLSKHGLGHRHHRRSSSRRRPSSSRRRRWRSPRRSAPPKRPSSLDWRQRRHRPPRLSPKQYGRSARSDRVVEDLSTRVRNLIKSYRVRQKDGAIRAFRRHERRRRDFSATAPRRRRP